MEGWFFAGFGISVVLVSAPMIAGATTWTGVTRNIEFGCRTSVWQQECEDGMFIEPHCRAMRLQHSCSDAVISAPGRRHAIAGKPDKTTTSRVPANWRQILTLHYCTSIGKWKRGGQNSDNA